MRVALVHDYLNQRGGAERVVQALAEIFPEAPIFTSLYDPDKTWSGFRKRKICTSFLQKIPKVDRFYKGLLYLYPLAFTSLGYFREFDVVISSSSTFAKGIKDIIRNGNPNRVCIFGCFFHPRKEL